MSEKDEKALQARLLMMKGQMEKKLGKSGKSSSKSKVKESSQEDFLKKLKSTKKETIKINVDINQLKRVNQFNSEIDLEIVIEYVKSKLWSEPKNIDLLSTLSSAYILSGDFDKAKNELKKATTFDEKNINIKFNKAFMYFRQKMFSESLKECLSIIEKTLDLDTLYLTSIIFYISNSKAKAIEFLLKALQNDKDFIRVHKNLAFLHFLKNDIKNVKITLNKLLEKDEKNIIERLILQNLYLNDKEYDNYKQLEIEIGKIKEQDQKIKEPLYYINRATYLFAHKEKEKAYKNLDKAIKLEEGSYFGLIMKSNLYLNDKELDKAFEIIYENAKNHLDNILILSQLLKIYFYQDKQDKQDEFNKLATMILKLDKDFKVSLKIQGKAFEKAFILFKEDYFKTLKEMMLKFDSFEFYNINDVLIKKLLEDYDLF